ncbi:VOC family protein [Caenimonas terrae]|uniref:VOC family protein n=1 Tax=Caenimonas terrae TaxID=696074 RepID=A0ABW0NDD3_9BURK
MSTFTGIDHLVVAADSLQQGIAWCESTLFVTPGPGGEHPLMGTHNLLLKIETAQFARAYLEIIAIDPQAADPRRKRWFDLDDAQLRAAVKEEPRLVHFVASCERAAVASSALDALGIDRGPQLAAQRETARGPLKWKISVRDDGQRLFYGCLPTLIEWAGAHPAEMLPDSGLKLLSLTATHPRPDDLFTAYRAIHLEGVGIEAGPPNLSARLMTPLGEVTIDSRGL